MKKYGLNDLCDLASVQLALRRCAYKIDQDIENVTLTGQKMDL